jgi:hypothetical protein
MTRASLVDWIQVHGCDIEQLPEINNRANVIKFVNPKTNGRAYVSTPIDETEVYDYKACHICTQLGIPIPDCVSHYQPLYKHIRDNHGRK